MEVCYNNHEICCEKKPHTVKTKAVAYKEVVENDAQECSWILPEDFVSRR